MKQFIIVLGLIFAIAGVTFSCGSEKPKANLNPVQVGRSYLNDRGIDAGYQKGIDLHAQDGILTYRGEKYEIAHCDLVPHSIAFAVNQKDGAFRIVRQVEDKQEMVGPEEWWASQGSYLLTDPKHCIGDGTMYVSDGPRIIFNDGLFPKVQMKIRNISGRDIDLARIRITFVDEREVQLSGVSFWIGSLKNGEERLVTEDIYDSENIHGRRIDHIGDIRVTGINFQ